MKTAGLNVAENDLNTFFHKASFDIRPCKVLLFRRADGNDKDRADARIEHRLRRFPAKCER